MTGPQRNPDPCPTCRGEGYGACEHWGFVDGHGCCDPCPDCTPDPQETPDGQ